MYELIHDLCSPACAGREPGTREVSPHAVSDYDAFWRARIPFLFLSAGRSRVYHTPDDTPDRLDYEKITATSHWLARFVDAMRTPAAPIVFDEHRAGHASTVDENAELLVPLAAFSPSAEAARRRVSELRTVCDRHGRLPEARYAELEHLVHQLEAGLAGESGTARRIDDPRLRGRGVDPVSSRASRRRRSSARAYEHQRAVERNERIVVGVNDVIPEEATIPIGTVDPQLETDQVARVQALRAKRNAAETTRALTALDDAAAGTGNLVAQIVGAVRASATVGEIADVLRKRFGEYHPAG